MVTFWLLSALLIALALLFFWIPFFKRNESADADIDRNALNVEIFKSRLAELKQELADNNLDQAGFDELKSELEKSLLTEVDDAQATFEHKRPGLLVPLSLTVLVPAVAVLLYLQWGALDDLGKKPTVAESAPEHQMQDLNQQLEGLKAKLEANPNDPEGWFMLGRSYMAMERFPESLEAFERLTGLVGDHPEILSQQANALYFMNNNRINEQAQQYIDKALALNPNDAGTLSLLGMASFESGEFLAAYKHWQQLLNSNQEAVNREALLEAITQVKQVMDEQGIAYPQTVAVEQAPGAELQVSVSLDEGVSDKVNPDTIVYVLAQAAQGSRMPLAAVKLAIKDLPTTVTLNDSQAMGPMANLSSADTVIVRALVSLQGTAAAAPGDLYGLSQPVKVQGNDGIVELNIDQVVE